MATGFLRVMQFQELVNKGNRANPQNTALTTDLIIPVDDINNIAPGKTYHDDVLGYDVETVVIMHMDGQETEVVGTIPQIFNALEMICPCVFVDPRANETGEGLSESETSAEVAGREQDNGGTTTPAARGPGKRRGASAVTSGD